jgi:molybdenum cofactor cytidylyltransferase
MRIAALVLAAGSSRRMEGANKLLAPVGGVPLVVRAVDAVLGAGVEPAVVVLGHDAGAIEGALARRPVRFVHNGAHHEGLGASLRAGVAALEADVDAALVVLADVPWLRPEHVRHVTTAFDPARGATICVPVHGGRRGHPVLFGACHFAELRRLGGDVGARAVVARHPDAVREVVLDDADFLVDVDTREALAAAQSASRT